MDSKAKQYVKQLGKTIGNLPTKYQENFEVMDEFAEIMKMADSKAEEYKMAKEEWQDYDEKILAALKRDYPKQDKPKERKSSKAEIKGMPPVDEKGKRRIDKAALDALEDHLEGLPQTKALHSKDGDYSQQRQSLHEQIITKEVTDNECIRRDAPIAILTGGLPGSGKSTYIRKHKDWMTNPAIFKIDADDLRAKLPEYKGWNATQTHEETRDLVKTLLNKVGKTGCSYDVIYDGTMNKSKKYKPLVETLKKEGYRVFIMFLKVDKKTSMTRAMNRYQKSGRYVPRFVIDEAAENGLAAFNELKDLVDGYVLVDGKTQKVIEQGGANIPEDRNYAALAAEPAPKAAKKKSSSKKPTSKDHVHSWKKVTPKSKMKPVVLHCQHYQIPVKEETVVGIKGAGKHTNTITAKPGEHLIFDDQGHLVFIMDAGSFARKCNDQGTVDEHIKEKHKIEKTPQVTVSKKSTEKKAPKPRKEASPTKTQERRSPYQVLEAEIKDVTKILDKKKISKEDADQLPEELKDIEQRSVKQSTINYIEKKARQIEEGKKLSRAEVIKLALAAQPLVRSGRSVVLDTLFTNKKRLEPTVDGLLRWLSNPSGYDLIGVDVKDSAKATVKPRRPKQDLLTILKIK
ncbi:MAG TPA: zeta toxin family protein [Saprospiraceae bacterium]|nr:zeta toxin family protein [Saprospiraceae bacterium]